MTDNATAVLGGLGSDFPQHSAVVAAMDQALNDIVGTAFGNSEFVDAFVEAESDAVLLEVTFVSSPLLLSIPGLATFSVSIGQADELELEVTIVIDAQGARCLL